MAISPNLNLLQLPTRSIAIPSAIIMRKIVICKYYYRSALSITALSSSVLNMLTKEVIPASIRSKIHIT